jgi:hypothetical protein
MHDRTTLFLVGVTLALAGLAWWRGGMALVLAGLIDGGKTLLGVVPLLLAAFAAEVVPGLQEAVSRHRNATT